MDADFRLWRAAMRLRIDSQNPARHGNVLASPLQDDSLLGMSRRFFDLRFEDGRVYRVRVSDITPEKVEA